MLTLTGSRLSSNWRTTGARGAHTEKAEAWPVSSRSALTLSPTTLAVPDRERAVRPNCRDKLPKA